MSDNLLPATLQPIRDIVAEYDYKVENVKENIQNFESSVTFLETQCVIGGAYAHSIWGRGGKPYVSEKNILDNLKKSAWMHVYKLLNIDKIASASDRKKFEMSFESAPDFTLDNVRATFKHYITDFRFHILKGLAECFVGLDPYFKSHSKIKVGVTGLPKRIIIEHIGGEYGYGSYGRERLKDVLNAIKVFEGQSHLEYAEFDKIIKEALKGDAKFDGMKLKIFKNGNGHLSFETDKLLSINKALAEFYGDVLPDAEDEVSKPKQSTAVSKDLQYYPTPNKVLEEVLNRVDWRDINRFLEPSCGDGRILQFVKNKSSNTKIVGIEYDFQRAEEARSKGFSVYNGNFLEVEPAKIFDLIIMNPPFYGTHWKKHLEHAIKFLKPRPEGKYWGGGQLICILPASAFYDGHLGDMGLVSKDAHLQTFTRDTGWYDLPVASFAESGTNIPTGYFKINC